MTLGSDTITLAGSTRIEAEIARRGIKLRGKVEREGPCPVCGGTDRFSVHVRKQLFNCRGFGGGDVIAMVQHLDGCSFVDAVHTLAGTRPGRPAPKLDPVRMAEAQAKAEQAELEEFIDENDRFWKAVRIWHEAMPRIDNTPAEVYLRNHRKLDIPDGVSGHVLRYHPACPFGRGTYPCMVALVRNIETNAHQAIHRTALHLDGTPLKIDGKTARKALGSTKNGAVKLTDDADVSTGLYVGEGLETVLAGMMPPRWYRPAWALLSAGNIGALPVLAGIECLTILVDHDRPDKHGRRAGEAAARECAERWAVAGREVIGLIPTIQGEDIADVASHRRA
jgi:putative DNA primase/helicase